MCHIPHLRMVERMFECGHTFGSDTVFDDMHHVVVMVAMQPVFIAKVGAITAFSLAAMATGAIAGKN